MGLSGSLRLNRKSVFFPTEALTWVGGAEVRGQIGSGTVTVSDGRRRDRAGRPTVLSPGDDLSSVFITEKYTSEGSARRDVWRRTSTNGRAERSHTHKMSIGSLFFFQFLRLY